MSDDLTLFINFLIASGLLGVIGKYIPVLYRKYIERKTKKSLEEHNESLSILEELLNETSLNRVGLFSCHDGGGIPGIFNKPKITMIDEKYDEDRCHPMKEHIQSREVDKFHSDTLIIPLINGEVPYIGKNILDKYEQIKDIYDYNNHKTCECYLICINATEVIYLALFSPGDIKGLPPEEKEKIRSTISKLKNMYKR